MRVLPVVLVGGLILGGTLAIKLADESGGVSPARAASGVRYQSSSPECRTRDAGILDDFSAGSRVSPYALTGIAWNCEDTNSKTYVYGTCTPPPKEGGCAPPVNIQLFRVCERNPALLHPRVRRGGRRTTLRGVPARVYHGGTWIELYSARTAIVIWAGRPGLGKAAVRRLIGAGSTTRSVDRGDDLPAPVRGAVAGKAAC